MVNLKILFDEFQSIASPNIITLAMQSDILIMQQSHK